MMGKLPTRDYVVTNLKYWAWVSENLYNGEKLFVEIDNKLDIYWVDGVYVGHNAVSGESIIVTKRGFHITRTVKRNMESKRQNRRGRVCYGRSHPTSTYLRPPTIPDMPDVTVRQEAPRRMYVRIDDIRKHVFTIGCAGCRAIECKGPRIGHDDACRERAAGLIRSSLVGLKRVEKTKKRENYFLADQVKKHEEEKLATVTRPTADTNIP